MRKFAYFLAVLVTLSVTVCAQVPSATSGGPSVSLIAADPVTVAPGKTAPAVLLFKVNSGFHINSNKPKSELLIPTSLRLSPPTDVMIARISYPAGEELIFPFSEEKLSVYSGEFKVTPMVRAAQALRPGTYRIHGELKYQACNDRQCFPPKTLPIAFDMKVAKATVVKKARRSPGQSPHIKR